MADTAVLRVDVASADFDKFQATFNQYAKTLEQTLATWSKITTEVKAASAAMTNMAAPVARSTASLQKFTAQFAETAKHTASIRTNVESITKGLVSWKTAIGSTLALLGIGAGVAGINALISGAVDARNKALAQGMGYGAARGAALMPGGGAMMQGWGTARWDPTSGAYRGAQTLFGTDTNRQLSRDDPRAFVDALNKATTYLGQFDEKIRGTIAQTTGLNDFLGGEALRTWQTLTDQAKKGNKAAQEELDIRIKAYTAAGEAAKQAEEGVRKWATFYISLESARSVLQDVLVAGLSPLAKPLGELATSLTKAVAAFLQTDEVKDTIKRFGDELQSWATWLGTKEGQKEFDDFIKAVGAAAKILAEFTIAVAKLIGMVANSPVGKAVGSVMKAFPSAVEGLQKEGIGATHFGPLNQDDINRNLRLGYDKYGAKLNEDGSSANFPAPGQAVQASQDPTIQSTPWYKKKNFGFGWSGKAGGTPGGAATTPAPSIAATAIGGQDSRLGEKMMQWFGQESAATQKAADAAEKRDTKLERLLVSMEKWFQGGQEIKPRTLSDIYKEGGISGLGGSSLLPPWARGVLNTMKPTPAETGELSSSFLPGGAGANAFAASVHGGAGAMLRSRGTGGQVGGGVTSAAPFSTGGGDIATQSNVDAAIRSTAASAGMDPAHWKAIASIESSLNPAIVNKFGYSGLFQMGSKPGQAWSQYGGGGNILDPTANARGAAALAQANIKIFKSKVGRDPTPGEIYLMHQQGAGFMTSSSFSQKNVMGNLPPSLRGASWGSFSKQDFVQGWENEVDKRAAKFSTGAATAIGNASPNSTSEIRGPGGGNAADANALLAEVKKTHPHFSNEECVTLVKEYAGMGGTVRDWRRGESVMSGDLKIGTPIATFMNRQGQPSELYDAGIGVGKRGAGTTHGALFGGYTYDSQGNKTGMKIVNQWAGSGGARISTIPMHGFGEHGAENYNVIRMAGQQGKGPQTAGGLDNDNWQQKPIHNVNIHNKSGSDVHIAASTVMAST